MLVLLDLIGVAHPSFYNYFQDTDRWYKRLVTAEDKLAELQLLKEYDYGLDGYPRHRYFNPQSVYAGVEDDHIPFQKRGDLISNQFLAFIFFQLVKVNIIVVSYWL
jgi:glutaminyl-peptide cyclotransferase